MGFGGIDGESKCFVSGCEGVVGKGGFQVGPHRCGGGVGNGFTEVYELAGKVVKKGALFVSFSERLSCVS